MVCDGNDLHSTAAIMTVDGCRTEKPLWFFLERYTQAFIDEAASFVDAIANDKPVPANVVDGLIPVLMAKAATESCRAGGKYVKGEKY